MHILETPRLIMRMLSAEDFEAYAIMCADPEVMRYLGEGKPLAPWETWRQMAMIVGHWQLRGYGLWAVEERQSGNLAGRVGLFNPHGWPGFEVGWALAREHWGKGYATEAARAALKHAFTKLNREHVISLIHPENVASIRVAVRLGESLEGKTELFGRETLIYGIAREKWQSVSA